MTTSTINIAQVLLISQSKKGTVEKLHVLDKKDFCGNMFKNIEEAVLFIQIHTNLEYKIEKLRREEIPAIPEPAIREAVVNAVCHRDYFEKGASVMIEIFDDRVEISNPGGLPPGLSPRDFGKKSVLRNPVIANLLHRADYIEKLGTGINRIKNAVKDHGKVSVEFSYSTFFTVVFKFGSHQEVGEKVGEKLTNNQLEIVQNMKENPRVSAKELSNLVGISQRKIEENISKLKSRGIIKRIGSAKGGYWEI